MKHSYRNPIANFMPNRIIIIIIIGKEQVKKKKEGGKEGRLTAVEYNCI